LDLNSIEDAEKFAQHFVKPLVDEVKRQLEPLVGRVTALEAGEADKDIRLKKLEGIASKLATVYTGIITVTTFGAHYLWGKMKSKFNLT
jgi:hypothetical protein